MKNLLVITSKIIATGSGLGYIPIAPGTMGALGGMITGVLLRYYTNTPDLFLCGFIILFFIAGVICSNFLEQIWGKDPSRIVIDEVVGMWLAMLFIPKGWVPILGAFIFFRLFDIYKPFYIRKTERLKGGWGVMVDDVVAGIYANLLIQLLMLFVY